MIYLNLFLVFLKIGVVSFGGGYAMIPLIQESVIDFGWLTEEQFVNFIAVAESTPGPIAINMATYIGSTQAGILGAIVATIGVVLPSFVIILLISAVFKNLLQKSPIKAFLNGIKPVIVALILATSITLFLSNVCGIGDIGSAAIMDVWAWVIMAILSLVYWLFYKFKKKQISPILLIILSGIMGIIVYGLV